MVFEPDTPPPFNTFRRAIWHTMEAIAFARAFWGRRLFGGAIGLMADALSEGANQSFYARLPGHSQQALDSLDQVGKDTDLFRFRGESDANWKARVRARWDDYAQGGTDIQLLRVINQWGNAGWPVTWNNSSVTLVESGDPADFSFTLTIGYGIIAPPWTSEVYGSGHLYGEVGFFYGLGSATDLATLLYLVRKWKRSTSRAHVNVYLTALTFVSFTV